MTHFDSDSDVSLKSVNVKAAVKLSGVSEHTLRAWERRYGAVHPKRTDTGRRIYDQKDIERLRILAALVHHGHAISGIAGMTDDRLQEMYQASSKQISEVQSTESRLLEDLHSALRAYQLEKIGRVIMRARAEFGVKAFILKVISPLLKEVGNQVADGKLSIAQEHALSAILRHHLGQILQSLDQSFTPPSPVRAAFCTPEGNMHEFGILLSAILFSANGYHIDYLGPNLPASDFASAAQALRSSILVMGFAPNAPAGSPGSMRVSAEEYLRRLDGELSPQVEFWIGGCSDPEVFKLQLSRTLRRFNTLEDLEQALIKTSPLL